MKKLTTQEEILAISLAFNIPSEELRKVLNQQNVPAPPKKNKFKKVLSPKIEKESEKVPSNENSKKFTFDAFEGAFINATNPEEELAIIKEFLPLCCNTRDTKTLYQLCPETEKQLKDEIIYLWVQLSNNFADIQEVKPLTIKGTLAAEIAKQKYIKFF